VSNDKTKNKAIISVARDGGSAYFDSKLLEKKVRRKKKVFTRPSPSHHQRTASNPPDKTL
jgi:hypothetical protein